MDFEQLCKDVMDIDTSIRFAMVVDNGTKRIGGYRYDVVGMLDSNELEQSIAYAHERMEGRRLAEDKLGRTRYAMAEYEKVKRVTFPISEEILLLVSMDPDSNHLKIIEKILTLLK